MEENDFQISEESVARIFAAWHTELHPYQKLSLTPPRHDAICHALRDRRGTVEEICDAMAVLAANFPDGERSRQRCTDLPHILHRDRLADAIRDDIDPESWTSSPFDDEDY